MATIRDKYVLDVDTKGAQRSIMNIKSAIGALAGALAIRELAQFTGSIVEATTTFERYQTVLTTFLGSQQAANKELQRLQELANTLPQDLMDISEAFIILNRYGLDTTNQGLREFSNIATANGKSIEQLAEAVGDALTGEYERLKEFGIKINKDGTQLIARIGDEVVATATSAKDLVNQLQKLGATRFGGAAEANADTLSQSLSNLRGAVFETQVAFGQGLKPELKAVADEMAELLRANDELAKNLGAGLGEAIRTLADASLLIVRNIDLIRNAFLSVIAVKFAQNLQRVFANFSRLLGPTKTLGGALGGLRGALVGTVRAIPGIGLIGGALKALMGPVGLVVTAVTGLTIVWRDVKDATVEAGGVTTTYGEIADAALWKAIELAKELFKWIGEKLVTAWNNLVEAVRPFKEVAVDAFTTVYNVVRTTVNGMIGLFVGLFKQITTGITDLPKMFLQALESSLVVIKEFVIRAGRQIGELWDYVTSLGKDEIESSFTGLGDVVSAELDKIASTSSIDWAEIMNTDYVGEAADAISEAVGNLVEEYRAAKPAIEDATNATEELGDTTKDTKDKVQELAAGVKEARQQIDEFVRSLQTATQDAQFDLQTLNMNELEKQIARIKYDINKGLAEEIRKLNALKTDDNAQEIAAQIQRAKDAAKVAIDEQTKIAEAVYEQQRSFEYGWKKAFDEYADNATNAAKKAEQIFKQTTQTMEDAIVDFAKTGKFEFRNLVADILEQLLRSELQAAIANIFSLGGKGGGASTLGKIFGGFFANGGYLGAGKFGVAGENGPELITGPAQITPLSGMGSGSNVTYNINAVDAMSFKQLVSSDPGFIHAVASQGARKVPNRR